MSDHLQDQKTPLYDEHVSLGAKVIGFGGWLMPVQYTGILKEHEAVRSGTGIFDISHMGEIWVEGSGAEAFLNFVLTNDVRKLQDGQGQYSIACNERGGVIDDLYVFRISPEKYFLVVNAAHIQEDTQWLTSHIGEFDVVVRDVSEQLAALAIQGPRVLPLLSEKFSLTNIPTKNGIREYNLLGEKIYLSRTGYTGEDGVEIFFQADHAIKIWRAFVDAGVVPCGLGCRDTLRLEACYPLNGNDLSPDRSPVEAGLSHFVSWEKPDFIGRACLWEHKTHHPPFQLVAFTMTEPHCPPPRSHYKILSEGQEIGEVTSGTLSPTFRKGIGMGYVSFGHSKPGQKIDVLIRDKSFPGMIVRKPFVKKNNP